MMLNKEKEEIEKITEAISKKMGSTLLYQIFASLEAVHHLIILSEDAKVAEV